VGPYGETYPTSHDAAEAVNVKAEAVSVNVKAEAVSVNVKAEAVSDAEEEEDPVPITFPEIKAEPEVSCVCIVRQITQMC
jgi:hypothetical protein